MIWFRRNLPRTRGDKPSLAACCSPPYAIYPAHAGINLGTLVHGTAQFHLPRTRGDKPPTRCVWSLWMQSTPHTRG